MALNPFFADAAVIAAVAAINTTIGSSGFLDIYSGAQPADANTAVGSQTKLAHLPLSSSAFGTPVASGSAGSKVVTATANTITSEAAIATGTAAWFRVTTSGGTGVFDGAAGTSAADLILSSTSVTSGQTVSVTSLTITMTE